MKYFPLAFLISCTLLHTVHSIEVNGDTNIYLNLEDMYVPESLSMSQDNDLDWRFCTYCTSGAEVFYQIPTGSVGLGCRAIYLGDCGIDIQARLSTLYIATLTKAEASALWFIASDPSSSVYLGTGYGFGGCLFNHENKTSNHMIHGPKLHIGLQKQISIEVPASFWDCSLAFYRLNYTEHGSEVMKTRISWIPTVTLSYGHYF